MTERALTPRPAEPLAAEAPKLRLRPRAVHGLIAAVVASGISIWAASGFTREPPPPSPRPPGMQVGDDNVTLAAGAPQWKVLRLGPVLGAAVHWSDPVPARVLVGDADLSWVWVVAELFEADVIGIAEGTEAKITSPSIPDLVLEAKVDMVSAVVDPTRHTVPVRVRLANEARLSKPNTFAQMRFQVRPPEGSVEVAASALVSAGAKQHVYVQTEHGRFTRREVVVGSVREGKVPVLSGLRVGEVVVEEGAVLLDNQISLSR